MAGSGYVTLTRHVGLMREMHTIANNIANLSTTGYRREGVLFSEYVKSTDGPDGSVSMAAARGRNLDLSQGSISSTGSPFDMAIQGDGFFLVDTPQGERLTRAGNFTTNENGDLVTPDGHLLLDSGGSTIFVPPDSLSFSISADGTVSADGEPISQVGLYKPVSSHDLVHESGVLFRVNGEIEPLEDVSILQGHLENANVDPVLEIARMIEVQRAYEQGQSFLEKEGDRISSLIKTLGR